MMATTCKIEYKDYVPYRFMAMHFFITKFYGNNANAYKEEWEKIKYDKYDRMIKEINAIKIEIEALNNDKTAIWDKIESRKGFFMRKPSKDEKERLYEIDGKILELTDKMNKKSDNKYYGVDELHRKVCKYLDDNGFRLISCSSSVGVS